MVMKADFKDSERWDDMYSSMLGRYTSPKWSKPCVVEDMELWLERLNLTVSEYEEKTNTSLADFIKLNPEWPLRAWIGTAMELKQYENT